MSFFMPEAPVTVLTTAFGVLCRLYSERCSLLAVPLAMFVSVIGIDSSRQISTSFSALRRETTLII